MTAILRTDPLTGRTAALTQAYTKPRPALVRTLPAPQSACAFCHITEARPDPGDRTEAQDDPRLITHANTHTIAPPNLYPLLGGARENHDPHTPPGQSALILTRRHATSLEEFTPDESHDLAELTAEVCAELDGKYRTVAALANIENRQEAPNRTYTRR